MRNHLLQAAGLAVAITALLPGSASADCQPPASIEAALAAAPVVFVGTVTGTLGVSGARLEVVEVWKGSLPGAIEVRGMADGVLLEDDRSWQVGQRYLVVPRVSGGILRDDICTATTPWRDELAILRPASVRAGGGGGSGVSGAVLVAVGVLAVLAISAFAFRRAGAGRWSLVVILALSGAAASTPARAACAVTAEAVAAAPIVFVGTQTASSGDGSSASLRVENVWRGAGLVVGEEVEVDAAPGTFALPPPDAPLLQYLMLVEERGGRLRTGDNCALFAFPWDPSYAAFRPAGAPPTSAEDAGIPWQVVVAIGASALLVIAAGFAFRRRPGDRPG